MSVAFFSAGTRNRSIFKALKEKCFLLTKLCRQDKAFPRPQKQESHIATSAWLEGVFKSERLLSSVRESDTRWEHISAQSRAVYCYAGAQDISILV